MLNERSIMTNVNYIIPRSRFQNGLRSLKNGNLWMNEIIFKFFFIPYYKQHTVHTESIYNIHCVLCIDCNHSYLNNKNNVYIFSMEAEKSILSENDKKGKKWKDD